MSDRDSGSRLGRVIRLLLRLIPLGTVIPVINGPMRGMRWTVGSAPHGAWLGRLERDKLEHFVGRLRSGTTVWDIGANVGLYTLPSARRVGPAGRVYAFEPMPRNVRFLRHHIALNHLGNVEVCEAAVADCSGTLRMIEGDSPSEFRVDPSGSWEVQAVTLDKWFDGAGSKPPDVIKIDVEGSDAAVLRGGSRILREYRPSIYLALHGEWQRAECGDLLTGWGYRLISMEQGRAPAVSSEWLAEPC